jgi:uncharacterized protein YjiS (DUF1127 family)
MTIALTLSQTGFSKFYSLFQTYFLELQKRRDKAKMIKKTIKELDSLSDRDLRDIGLSRYDIEMIAKEHIRTLGEK